MSLFGKFKSIAQEMDEIFEVFDKHDTWNWEWKCMNDVPAGKCIKCGSISIAVKYNSEKDKLSKKCLRCEYTWQEEPLDKEKKK